ncbi:MAG: division/cell wall cluster transcriptional repressor MraZ [Lachnospiraceae bacterium]|nr:division/cell wall cluster transcriptional repressor MraZ [Lachnospiraceae bacterium]
MLSGEYSHTLDAKKRLILPAKLREELGNEIVLTKNVDKCVSIYPRQAWLAFCEKLDALPDTETRVVKRFLYSAAFETTIDAQNRLVIPPNLCEFASLNKNVRVVGVGNRAEIWDEAAWNETVSAVNVNDVIAVMEKLGL